MCWVLLLLGRNVTVGGRFRDGDNWTLLFIDVSWSLPGNIEIVCWDLEILVITVKILCSTWIKTMGINTIH